MYSLQANILWAALQIGSPAMRLPYGLAMHRMREKDEALERIEKEKNRKEI